MATVLPESAGTWRGWHAEGVRLRLGVSSCLLGETVRYDGGHARDRFVSDVLSRWIEWVPVCPEFESGMGIPRPTIRLVDEGDGAGVRLVAPSTGEDFTERMRSFSAGRVGELDTLGLDGFVLKKNSPSCGLERIAVYRAGQRMHRNATGLFAEALSTGLPDLPVEEEGRLNDPMLRENFIERIFCRNRWRSLLARGIDRRRLVEFHTAHKLILLAHNESAYRRLGRLVGNAGSIPDEELYETYGVEFQRGLRSKATIKRNVNVLQHALGHFKKLLGPKEKRELTASIEDYHRGFLPLVVPLALLRFNARKFEVDYLVGQLYFDPHPKELMLRNHC